MLSMFKDKKGFSVLFRNGETDAAAPSSPPPASETDASTRRSSRVSSTVGRYTGGSGVAAALQCQRCSKRFSASADDDEDEAASCCRRCGYPTCPQCREAVAGTPPWVCCVCDGPKSFMWLLEKTNMGPRLVSKIVEFCDPRGQRLMRSMFRFTLQQYRTVSSPRPSLTIDAAGRLSTSRTASGGVSTAARTSGERGAGSTGLRTMSTSHSNVRRPSPYVHPKHASLLRSMGRLPEMAGKENSQAAGSESPVQPRGSEALRRDDAVAVVAYSPEPNRQAVTAEADAAGHDRNRSGTDNDTATVADTHTPPPPPPRAEDRCAAVQDIYRASDTATTPRSTVASTVKAEEVSASPHVRPSGHAAFQREPLRQLPPNATTTTATVGTATVSDPVTPVGGETAAAAAALQLESTTMSITPPGQPCRFGRSLSRDSSGSGRSESPAPRFPSFAQFLDDQAAVVAGQTHLPRESDVLVTVSPDSSDDERNARASNVIELGGTQSSRPTAKGSKSGLRTPRGTQVRTTPPSAGESSSHRHERRTSGLSGDFTPTRALDLSDARGTVRRGSSSRRRTTRGSLLEMHAPHLYGSGGGGKGTGRRSGQAGDSPFMYDLPGQFSGNSGGARVGSARGQQQQQQQVRRQHAPLATRTAGRPLGGGGLGDARSRLVRQNSRTTTPLQRIPSGSRAVARTNSSSSAAFARKNSASGRGVGYGRMNSGTAQLTRTPSSRTRLAGVPLSPNGRALPQQQQQQQQRLHRTESSKLVRTASSGLPQPPYAVVPAALERTNSHYGLSANASPLKRTASHGGLGGPSPFARFHSTTAFTRSATATAGFTRTHSATVLRRSGGTAERLSAKNEAAHRPAHAFARTATGTYLSGGGGGRSAALHASRAAPLRVSYAWRRGTSARTTTPTSRLGAATPLQRTNTATRTAAGGSTTSTATASAAAAVGGARPPTPRGFTRTGTNPRAFERQPSHPLRQPPASRTRVDPAPALVGVARRKAPPANAGLRRTPSAMARTDSATATTPRTPRPFIISSVSTAGTPAASATATAATTATYCASGTAHGGARPVLSSGASSPKTRSTRDSLTSGSAGTTRTSGGGGGGLFSPISTTPVVKAPAGVAMVGRTSVPRRRPGAAPTSTTAAAATAGRTGAFSRLGTGTRTRSGSTRPPSSGFTRLNSRPAA